MRAPPPTATEPVPVLARPSSSKPRPTSALRQLLPFVLRYRALTIAWLIALALSSSATLSMPLAVRYMIDEGFAADAPHKLSLGFQGLLLVAALLATATALRFYFISTLAEQVIADLRRAVYDRLLTLDMAFFERARTGELISRLSADTELLRTVVSSTASIALRSFLTLVGSAVAITVTSPDLAGMAALGIPMVVLPIVVFGRRVRRLSRASQDRLADANARATETLGAVHTVQSYARESHESELFEGAVDVALTAARRRIAMQALMSAVVIMLVFGAIGGVLYVGAKGVSHGTMSGGTLGQFLLYAALGAGSVGSLSEVWAQVQRAGGGMSRLGELLAESPSITVVDSPTAMTQPVRGAISFTGVTFAYPSRPKAPVLTDFSLQVKPGETIALVGPSGAGKSTVLALLLRFYDNQKGRIEIDGEALTDLDPRELRSEVALVPQDPILFGTTAGNNLRYGRLDASDDLVVAAAKSAEAHDFISALPDGYDTFLGERGVRLSGGQQQRMIIARALLKDAPILLLDEATSSLDAQSEHAIQQALERLMEGRTTVVIAHRLSTVRKADRIVVMEQGRIVAEGRHEELVAQNGLYAELARLQFSS